MNYLCGKDCPAMPNCSNAALHGRTPAPTQVYYTGNPSRGFGLRTTAPVAQGSFIIEYRGEIIPLTTYFERIRTIYAASRDFYALDYDMDEVIDAGQKGNEARFVNHSCEPNCEVRKYQTAGDGFEEYEIGFWALRDIQAGEEVRFVEFRGHAAHPTNASVVFFYSTSCATIISLIHSQHTIQPTT